MGSLHVKVDRIERDLKVLVARVAAEPFWVTHYGAFDLHPQYLVYWICVRTDREKERLGADSALLARLRAVLVSHNYPAEGRESVHIGFESQETVDRESRGNWRHHWQ